MPKPKVLFLCTRNSARSQMAEGFLRKYAGDRFEVYSAGLEPEEIHPYTKTVMDEVGINISNQQPKDLKHFLGRIHFGYLIVVCEEVEARCPVFPGIGVRLYWPFEDPVVFQGSEVEQLQKFRKVRDQIGEKIKAWLKENNLWEVSQ